MRISVAIAAYNAAEYLREALTSVLAQSLQPFEIVVVDDGSSDNTREVCESFGDRGYGYRIRWMNSVEHIHDAASAVEDDAVRLGLFAPPHPHDDASGLVADTADQMSRFDPGTGNFAAPERLGCNCVRRAGFII